MALLIELERRGWKPVEITELRGGDRGWRSVVGKDGEGDEYKLLPERKREKETVVLAAMVWPSNGVEEGLQCWIYFVGTEVLSGVFVGPAVK